LQDPGLCAGGAAQAQLRIRAGKEIAQHPERHPGIGQNFAGELVKSGVWADSVSMLALVRALEIELRIFAWSEETELWQLYELKPMVKARRKKIVWLELRSHHYLWLKVVARVPEAVRVGATIIGGEENENQGFFEAHPSARFKREAGGAAAMVEVKEQEPAAGDAADIVMLPLAALAEVKAQGEDAAAKA
jgi:hypothetical protein